MLWANDQAGWSVFSQRAKRVIGDSCETDRWISLHAVEVLKQAGD